MPDDIGSHCLFCQSSGNDYARSPAGNGKHCGSMDRFTDGRTERGTFHRLVSCCCHIVISRSVAGLFFLVGKVSFYHVLGKLQRGRINRQGITFNDHFLSFIMFGYWLYSIEENSISPKNISNENKSLYWVKNNMIRTSISRHLLPDNILIFHDGLYLCLHHKIKHAQT